MSKRLLLLLFAFSLLFLTPAVAGRQLLLRPLNAAESRDLLDQHQLAEGRSVRSGLAALTGYTLGLSKALVGVFIYDVITANVSDIESETTSNGYAQQVCFNTARESQLARSNDIDGVDDDDDNDDAYNPYDDDDVYADNLGRQTTDTDSSLTSTDSVDTTTTSDANTNVATCIILYRNR